MWNVKWLFKNRWIRFVKQITLKGDLSPDNRLPFNKVIISLPQYIQTFLLRLTDPQIYTQSQQWPEIYNAGRIQFLVGLITVLMPDLLSGSGSETGLR